MDVDNTPRAGAHIWLNQSGNVGVGTTNPGQKLSVAGTIESTSGGVKFPDGTVQTTAVAATLDCNDASNATTGSGAGVTVTATCAGDRTVTGGGCSFASTSGNSFITYSGVQTNGYKCTYWTDTNKTFTATARCCKL
jgi:hypothetical protein